MLNIKYKLDTIIIPDSEEHQEIRFNPEDYPKSESGVDLSKDLCYWDEENEIIIAKTDEMILDEYKENYKESIILSAFAKELKQGYFSSTVLSIDVDCRRTDIKNDLQNVQGLTSYMTRNNIVETPYKGYDESVTATVSDLETLCNEMEDHVLGLYQKKWTLESQIQACATKEEVDAISW